MNTGLKILFLGASLSLIACGDDTGGAGGSGGGSGGSGTTTGTTTTTGDATTTTSSGGGAGGEDPGTGGGGGAGGGEECVENVEDCQGCSSMYTGGMPQNLCICSGPPASADIFAALVDCTCTNCADFCADNACAGSFPSDECQACITDQCGEEDAACMDD